MKLKPFIISSLVLTFYALCPSALPGDYTLESPFTLSFQHRFRIKTWDNAISLNDRSADATTYTRQKSSFAVLWKANENLELYGKLTNEFRVYLAPKGNKYNNEIFFDNLYLKWKQSKSLPFTLTIGRQDISLGEGFIVQDGQAGTGSRSFYFNAVRLDLIPWENHQFTLYYGYVPRTDNLLPVIKLTKADDQILEEQAYTSLGVYYAGVFPFAKLETYFIRKDSRENEFFPTEAHFNTFGARIVGRISDHLNLTVEAALQRGRLENTASAGQPSRSLRGFGGHTHLDYNFSEDFEYLKTISLGGILLSGDDPATADRVEAWDPVHSRWPKWSDSYVYTLIKESRVAYWSNLNALYLTLNGKIVDNLSLRLSGISFGAQYAAPAASFPGGNGKNRGLLALAQLLMTFNKNLSGHLLWEYFIPGDFYFPEADNSNWLRFELLIKF